MFNIGVWNKTVTGVITVTGMITVKVKGMTILDKIHNQPPPVRILLLLSDDGLK